MKAKNSPTSGTRILQGVAIASALLLGAGYVWWAQMRADARIHEKDLVETTTLSAPGAEMEGDSPTASPLMFRPGNLAPSSKTSVQSSDLFVPDGAIIVVDEPSASAAEETESPKLKE